MLVSIIYLFTKRTDLPKNYQEIKKNIFGIDYDRGKFEILFLVNTDENRVAKAGGPPMARIFYYEGSERDLFSRGILHAHGEVLAIGDCSMRIGKDVLKRIATQKDFVGEYNGALLVHRTNIGEPPKDVACWKTYVAIDNLANRKQISNLSKMRLNRREILRFAYVHSKFTLRQKFWLLWKYIGGTE